MSDKRIRGTGEAPSPALDDAHVVLPLRVSLLVRVWKEPREGEERPEFWRASITDLGTGTVRYADSLASLIATIAQCGGIPLGIPGLDQPPDPAPRQ